MPRDTASIRMERLNSLMMLLMKDGGAPKKRLINELEYNTTRTLERDIELLRDRYGVEIFYNQTAKKYSCKDCGQFMLRYSLSANEVTALAAGLKMAAHFLPHLEKDAQRIWEKTARLIPTELLKEGEELSASTVFSIPVSAMDSDIFQRLIEAAACKESLLALYASPYKDELPLPRTLSPWGVYFQAHAWYLWAGSDRHPNGATYKISRITKLSPSNEPFLEKPEKMNVRRYASSAWFASPGELKYSIKFRLKMPLAAIVAETQWHPTQQIEWQTDDSMIYTAQVPDLEEVARWCMSCAPYIEVLEPEELRGKVRELNNSLLRFFV